jgi:hypothetical protein
MIKKTGQMSGGRAVLTELQNIDGEPCKPEIIGCCLRILGNMNVHGTRLRRELNAKLDVLQKTFYISKDHTPMKAARTSLKE